MQGKREEDRILLGCRPRIGLNIDTPYGRIEVEGVERPLATEDLKLVDPFVAPIITRVGQTFRVLVGQDGAVGLHSGTRRQVL